jgi:hypothetical protein
MRKRSRDVSFSPAAEDPSLHAHDSRSPFGTDTNAPPGKVKLLGTTPPASDTVMQCSLPPHRAALAFTAIEDFEIHYAKEHTNRCSSCGKNFPTARFLALHIDENHNALRESQQAKGEKTYACFVEDCDRKCATPQKRRLHLIDKHMFPKAYNFRIVDNGIDRTTSMLREGQRRRISTTDNHRESFGHRRRPSSGKVVAESASPSHPTLVAKDPKTKDKLAESNASEDEWGRTDRPSGLQNINSTADVDELERSMSALRFIPSSVLRMQGKKAAAAD